MKLFGGGKKSEDKPSASATEADDFDSPQENISFSNQPAAAAAPQRQAAAPVQQQHEEDSHPAYGIEQAIALMRTLPVGDNSVELVVTVIKATLESLRVKVSDIVEDAGRKQKDLEGRVANLKQAISDFEKEIATRKDEIARLEADHTETTMVKGRLELAEKMGKAQSTAQKSPSAVMGVIAKPSQPQGGKA